MTSKDAAIIHADDAFSMLHAYKYGLDERAMKSFVKQNKRHTWTTWKDGDNANPCVTYY